MRNKLSLQVKIKLILLVSALFGMILFANWIITFSNQFTNLLNK